MEKFLGLPLTTFSVEQFNKVEYRLSRPDIDQSSAGKYPLVVYLHGAGDRGTDSGKPLRGLAFLGHGISSQSRVYQKKYPSFVYVPLCPAGDSWQGKTLDNVISTIEHLKSTYPVDPERLYLIGFSMGGSGTYELARKYYDFNGQLFAGIIRLAGQSSFDNHVHEIVAKTSVWLHIGLQDTPLRVKMAREAYARQNLIQKIESEDIVVHEVNGREVKTSTLVIDSQEKVKLSEYTGVGHGINLLPFDDPEVLAWLFEKKLK